MLLYRILITLLAPLILALLFVRVLRGQETLADFSERCGIWHRLPKGKVIWLHGASNGELTAARPLVEGLRADATLLITCNSVTAKKMLLAWGLERVQIRLAPIDLRWLYLALMGRMQIERFILIEADFWPSRLMAAKARAGAVVLIAGRMSDKSARGWARFGGLAARVFATFDLICAQDQASEQRLAALGARPGAFGPRLALKSLYRGAAKTPDYAMRRNLWLAASTHEGEDETVLKAHLQARETVPDLRLILAPRHPKRAKAIAEIASDLGLSVTQRSLGAALNEPSAVYLADTLGEMEQWYRAAGVCFVAGSLVPKGGHTPFEPAFHDCALLHGPHLDNFTESYSALAAEAGAILCLTPDQIADALIALQDPALAQKLRSNARRALGAHVDLSPVLDAIFMPVKM